MKARTVALATLLFLVSLAASASTIHFINTGPYTYQGTPSYPYYTTVDGVPESLMCISYNNHISYGETWEVAKFPVAGTNEEEAAWLYLQDMALGGSDPDIQGAVWSLFAGNVPMTPGASGWLALAAAQTFHAGEFSDVVVYVPTSNQHGWTEGVPQTFLGHTPEPGTLALLGTGLVAACRIGRRLV